MLRLLPKEACLFGGADWLSSSVSQSVTRDQYSEVIKPRETLTDYPVSCMFQGILRLHGCVRASVRLFAGVFFSLNRISLDTGHVKMSNFVMIVGLPIVLH